MTNQEAMTNFNLISTNANNSNFATKTPESSLNKQQKNKFAGCSSFSLLGNGVAWYYSGNANAEGGVNMQTQQQHLTIKTVKFYAMYHGHFNEFISMDSNKAMIVTFTTRRAHRRRKVIKTSFTWTTTIRFNFYG